VNIDESRIAGETAQQFVQRLALEKARAGFAQAPNLPALGADTIVISGQYILGKPENKQTCVDMLQLLSGKTHKVMTAVAICKGEIEHCIISTSEVEFIELNLMQIEAYWKTREPLDKAGSYAIQGIAAQFIKNIKGSYSGIMGLPLFETAQLLNRLGIKTLT